MHLLVPLWERIQSEKIDRRKHQKIIQEIAFMVVGQREYARQQAFFRFPFPLRGVSKEAGQRIFTDFGEASFHLHLRLGG